jgi:CubicO group peptidase (beta-lactamase class C family)
MMSLKSFTRKTLATCADSYGLVHAQAAAPALPDPASTSVQAMGWMQGFPPAADKLITFDNPVGNTFPRIRWTFSHIREITPTANVWRGRAPSALRSARSTSSKCASRSRARRGADLCPGTGAQLHRRHLVMHKGRVIYEKYLGALEPQRPHPAMSVTKSFVGTWPRCWPTRDHQARGTGDRLSARDEEHRPWRRHGAPGDG